MANGRLLYDSLVDAATITSSTEATDLTDDQAVNYFPGKKWRTTADTSQWIKFDLGSAKALTCIGIFGHNFASGATVTLEGHTADSWGTPDFTQTLEIVTDGNSNVLTQIVEFFASTSKRWWRITIEDGSNPDGYIEIGRIMAGAYYEFVVNYSNGAQKTLVDPSHFQETMAHQPYVSKSVVHWRYSIAFNSMLDTQMKKLEAIVRQIGRGGPFMVSLDPTDNPTQTSIYCNIREDMTFTQVLKIGTTIYESIASMTFEELA